MLLSNSSKLPEDKLQRSDIGQAALQFGSSKLGTEKLRVHCRMIDCYTLSWLSSVDGYAEVCREDIIALDQNFGGVKILVANL